MKTYWDRVDSITKLAQRLKNVLIECLDFRKILEKYDSETTVFYLDPPYITETREEVIYKNEASELLHIELVEALRNLKGYAILSGYNHPIYNPLSDFMDKVEIETRMIMNHRQIESRRKRTEVLWYTRRRTNKQLRLF